MKNPLRRRETWEVVSCPPGDVLPGERAIRPADVPEGRLRALVAAQQRAGRAVVLRKVRGNHAWIALGLLIVGYEIVAAPGELLSEAVDRHLENHPIITRVVIGTVALHLLNLLPQPIDPLNHVARKFRRTVNLIERSTTDPPHEMQ